MQRTWAIAMLTWKAAFRFRLFWVLAALLLGAVLLLPLVLKDDQTARGFIQLVLTYNLSVITALLGLATLWLACGTLARDIEDCQMQVVAVKPIARWQIWLGKWLGILLVNAALLALAGGAVFGLLQWRAGQLPAVEQQILREEIFVARGSVKPPQPDLETSLEQAFRERLQQVAVPPAEHALLRRQLAEQLKAGFQVVPTGYQRVWRVDLGLRAPLLKDELLFLRVKFHVAQTNASGLYAGLWRVGVEGQTELWARRTNLAPDTFHELALPGTLIGDDGVLTVACVNPNPAAMIFPLEDGFEVLYPEGGFGLNFARGLAIILCWLGLLAAIGLAAASLLSFPVAAFVSMSVLVLALSSGTMSTVVAEGTVLGIDHETGVSAGTWVDAVMIPLFKSMLSVINLAQAFSPVDALSAGRSITWGALALAFVQIVLLLGGLFAAAGMVLFTRRELATASGNP